MTTARDPLVQRLWESFAERGVEGLIEHADPEAEFAPLTAGGRVLRGHAELRDWYEEQVSAHRHLESKLYAAERHGDRVLVHGELRVLTPAGLSDAQVFWLFELRGERIVRGESFATRSRALAALTAAA